jgi:predicted small lipoprotein YifL
MMKELFAMAVLLLPFALAGCSHPQPAPYYPPPAYAQAADKGHHDGIEAARRDIAQGASPNPDRHPRFRNPPVPAPLMDDYRHAFSNGYQEVYRHGPPRPGY